MSRGILANITLCPGQGASFESSKGLSRLKCSEELQHIFCDSVTLTRTIYTSKNIGQVTKPVTCNSIESLALQNLCTACGKIRHASDYFFNQETYPQHESFDANIPNFLSVQNSSTPRTSIRHWTFSLSTSPTLKSAIARGVGSAFHWSRKHLEHLVRPVPRPALSR
jgi:hypothetical protein